MDLTGVARAIDHAVYSLLNAIAMTLWRIDAALIGVSLFSYQTQDWLTGRDNEGVWYLLSWLVSPSGLINVGLWQLALVAALVIWGFSLILRPLYSVRIVDPSRLLFFAVFTHVLIFSGTSFMNSVEQWRNDAGSWVYEGMAASGATLNVPGASTDEPVKQPGDLDGEAPIRGWEAVSTSYFLASSADELHKPIPPDDFRKAYCLYDPAQPFDVQDDRNDDGCSPMIAWDEWDQLQVTLPITSVWGIPIPSISLDIPIVQEHPENRQLGIRQAMSGVGRLALGPVVALYPMIEANVGLMLTLAASIIYLSLPLLALFSFFLPTEGIFTRLFMQLVGIMVRTIILQGLVAIFLMLLINVSLGGSLTLYLGLVGVGIVAGLFLTRMATGVMKDTMRQTMNAVGAMWTGAAVTGLGEGARRPAQQAFGAAKWAATGAAVVATARGAGIGNTIDMAEPAYDVSQSGYRDITGSSEPYRLPVTTPSLGNWATAGGGNGINGAASLPEQLRRGGDNGYSASPLATGAVNAGASAALSLSADKAPQTRAQRVDGWVGDWYRSKAQQRGSGPVAETGRELLGESLHRAAARTMTRHNQAETEAVLRAAREVQQSGGTLVNAGGELSPAGVKAVQQKLDTETARAFSGSQGRRDLTVLTAVAAQSQRRAEAGEFRTAAAAAEPGQGKQAPARTVPQALGLDPVAAGASAAGLNRFSRLSAQAGLDQGQREQLLRETQSGNDEVSPELRREIQERIAQQGAVKDLDADALIASAAALPDTLSGPERIQFSYSSMDAALKEDRPKPISREEALKRAPKRSAAPQAVEAPQVKKPPAPKLDDIDVTPVARRPVAPASPLPGAGAAAKPAGASLGKELQREARATQTQRPAQKSQPNVSSPVSEGAAAQQERPAGGRPAVSAVGNRSAPSQSERPAAAKGGLGNRLSRGGEDSGDKKGQRKRPGNRRAGQSGPKPQPATSPAQDEKDREQSPPAGRVGFSADVAGEEHRPPKRSKKPAQSEYQRTLIREQAGEAKKNGDKKGEATK